MVVESGEEWRTKKRKGHHMIELPGLSWVFPPPKHPISVIPWKSISKELFAYIFAKIHLRNYQHLKMAIVSEGNREALKGKKGRSMGVGGGWRCYFYKLRLSDNDRSEGLWDWRLHLPYELFTHAPYTLHTLHLSSPNNGCTVESKN